MMETPTKTKIKFLAAFRDLFVETWRYILLYGGRSSGKSTSTALALLLRGRNKKLRILCTREYQNSIADSVHKLLKDLIEKYEFADYEVLKDRITNTVTGTEFIFRGLHNNVTEIKSTEGVDICWVEEAQSITAESIDILIPTIRKKGSQIIFTFNRVNELDPVYVRFVMNTPEHSPTFVKKINYDVLERAGLLTDEVKNEIEDDKKNPSLFAHKWLGEPLSQSDKAIISRDAVLNAMNRKVFDDGRTIIGVDVARMGDDRTVLWKRRGLKTVEHRIYTKMRTPEICDQIEAFAMFDKDVQIKVDDTGVGGGVTDEMLKREYEVVAVNFGGTAYDNDKYPNWISEAWFYMSGIMDQVELPMNSDLLMELSTRNWSQDSKGKRRVESKNEYKKRGYRSPDIADACIICYYEEQYITIDDINM